MKPRVCSAERGLGAMGCVYVLRHGDEDIFRKQADELSHLEVEPQSVPLRPTQSDLDIYLKLLKVREEQDRLKVQREFLESKLKLSIGTASSIEGLATWKGQWKHSFDVPAFRSAEPDLYAEMDRRFGSESYSRRFCIQRFD